MLLASGASGPPAPEAAVAQAVARRAPAARPVLGVGSRGAAVRQVQSLLNRHAFPVPVTGYYGTLTARQVRRFQTANSIDATGKVGPQTWPRLLGHPEGQAVVHLTFDDGPTPAWTPRVLELLARHRAQATFFVVGRNAAAHPELVGQAYAAGHGVGNHTWTHRRLTRLGEAALAAEVGTTSAAIQRATGAPVRCLRPPYATVDAASAGRAGALGLRLVMWDVDSNDWRRPGAGVIAGRVLGRVRSGDVVLLHDGGGDRSQTLAALEQILASLSARGFRFSPLCR
jgi:peptidoglycan/xylan/chitin deacetylase (PgdA/CDA1 family)